MMNLNNGGPKATRPVATRKSNGALVAVLDAT